MNGKLIGLFIAGVAVIAGAALYYLQVYYFYDQLPAGAVEIRLIDADTGQSEAIAIRDVRAIDAGSSPIRFRACFETPVDPEAMARTYRPYEGAEPLTAPGWFDCFDAAGIGAALEAGTARAYLSEPGIATGVDRVVAVTDDGRGYAWHQLQPGFGE